MGTESIRGSYKEKRDEETLQFILDYFPEREDILEKGRLPPELPMFLTYVEGLPFFMPEITEENRDLIFTFVNSVEKRLISIRGHSREEFKDILTAFMQHQRIDTDTKKKKILGYFGSD